MGTTQGKEIQRQITFSAKLYGEITSEADSENERMGRVLRKDKIHIQDMVPILCQDGLQYRRGGVYTPADKETQFVRDEKWVKLKAKAESALIDFMEYQQQLLAATATAEG